MTIETMSQQLKSMTDSEGREQLRTEFNEWARAGKGESMERGHRPVGEQAIATMNVPKDGRVLDIGCGSGWATRLLAESASEGRVTGIDISDEMIQLAREQSKDHSNVDFEVASAEQLPFADAEFTHAFSMESLYYYRDLPKALKEINRVMKAGGLFCAVVDMYWESPATHQWVESLKVPVQLLRVEQYRSLFQNAGFTNVRDQRVIDPRPVPDDYTSGSFNSRADFVAYREAGSLMITGEAAK
jgi:ubiquinone/menaquinone biosynthesis C-methylase UbiE